MPRPPSSVRRSHLALGVALLGVSLASSESATAAAMQFTTLHSATVSLSSLNNSAVSSSTTYSGPTTDTGDWTSPVNLSQSGTGSAKFRFKEFVGYDNVQSYWIAPNASDTFTIRMTWDVTFNSAQGGVRTENGPFGMGTLTATPLGGSAGALAFGDFLTNGRYTIQWDFNETIQRSGADAMLWFSQSSGGGGGGGGGVPLPGAAGLAACGLLGLSRRRRR